MVGAIPKLSRGQIYVRVSDDWELYTNVGQEKRIAPTRDENGM